jgi:hypothetical protein
MARAAQASVQAQDAPEDDTVDIVHETDDFRSGQVSEGELDLARSVAKRMGWTPKEEWKRDPAKWVDAPDFLENTPRELEAAKDRLKRSAQATEAFVEEEKRRARQQAIEELRAAERAGETDKANAAVERIRQTEGPPAVVSSWIAENSWFNTDPVAQAAARAVTDRLKDRPVHEQLEAAREEVKRRFPEHFDAPAQREEVRLSDVRRPPAPPAQQGSRGPTSAPKERGWSDLPVAARSAAAPFVRAFKSRGLSEAESQAKYAGSYWKDQA